MDSPSYFWFFDAHHLSSGQSFESPGTVFAENGSGANGYIPSNNSSIPEKSGYLPLDDLTDLGSSQNVEDLFLVDLFSSDTCNDNIASSTSSDHNTDGNAPGGTGTGSLWEIDDLLQSFTHSDNDSQVPNFPIGDGNILDANVSLTTSEPACEASLDEEIRTLLTKQSSPNVLYSWDTTAADVCGGGDPLWDSDFGFMSSEMTVKPKERQRCTSGVKDKGIAKVSSSTARCKKMSSSKGGGDGWTCLICGTVLLRDFTRHLRTHDEMARFQCPFPKERCTHATGQFNRQYDMKKHLLHDHFKLDRPEARAFTSLDEKLKEFGVCQCGFVGDARDYLDTHVLAGVCATMCPLLGSDPRPWALKPPSKPTPLMSAARQSLEEFRARRRYQSR